MKKKRLDTKAQTEIFLLKILGGVFAGLLGALMYKLINS